MSDKKFRGNAKLLNQCCRVLPYRKIEFQTNVENAIGLVCLNIQENVHRDNVVLEQLQNTEGQVARIES